MRHPPARNIPWHPTKSFENWMKNLARVLPPRTRSYLLSEIRKLTPRSEVALWVSDVPGRRRARPVAAIAGLTQELGILLYSLQRLLLGLLVYAVVLLDQSHLRLSCPPFHSALNLN